MLQHPKLADYLEKIRAVYDIDEMIHRSIDVPQIIDYYTQSNWGYSVFHSMRGAIHMALSSTGEFNRKYYLAQAEFIHTHISEMGHSKVLEIASGKGFNTIYLAKENKRMEFTGVDATPKHVQIATQKSQRSGLSNLRFDHGDFHALPYEENVFECAFEVESICNAIDLQVALASIYHTLKSGGTFVLFDSFKKRQEDLSPDEAVAIQLIEKSMSLQRFAGLDEFVTTAKSVGFTVLELRDISQATMPNLLRLEKLALIFFKLPILSRFIKWVLSDALVQNAIAGLLMPIASQDNMLGYFRIILQRGSD